MPIELENVGIAVRNLEMAISFFTDLGMTVLGRDTVSGEWTDTAVGLDGNHATIAMLQAPAGTGRLELFEYIDPAAIETEPTRRNEIGMHRCSRRPAKPRQPTRTGGQQASADCPRRFLGAGHGRPQATPGRRITLAGGAGVAGARRRRNRGRSLGPSYPMASYPARWAE